MSKPQQHRDPVSASADRREFTDRILADILEQLGMEKERLFGHDRGVSPYDAELSRMILAGHSNREIANILGASPLEVRLARNTIYRRLRDPVVVRESAKALDVEDAARRRGLFRECPECGNLMDHSASWNDRRGRPRTYCSDGCLKTAQRARRAAARRARNG
ncbi:hypothetical protein ACIRRA_43970 [Nocardia sp. NPDC101769]|uniref:hypothetical protein n=1 Tax=Nocardia sp. NPDC101769 TaxID=3364333 RepID=UPI003830BE12